MSEIVFDEARHEYRVGGVVWPGVTSVLDPINELDGIPYAVLRAASEFGRHVHTAIDFHNRGILDRAALDPHLEPYVRAWEKFLLESGATVIDSERLVKNDRHKYCGTLDSRVAWPRPKMRRITRHIVDVKSGLVPRTVGPQTAAYREALIDAEPDTSSTRYCVQLRADGTYGLHKLEDPTDWTMFISCLNIHRWRSKNAS